MAEGTRFIRMKDGREVYEVMGVYYDRKTGQQVWDNGKTAEKGDTHFHKGGWSLRKDGKAAAHPRVQPPAPIRTTPPEVLQQDIDRMNSAPTVGGSIERGIAAQQPVPQGRNWQNPYGQVSDKPSSGDLSRFADKPARPGETPHSAQETPPAAPPSPVGPAPSSTRRNPNGVVQSGRQLGGSLTLGDAVDYLKRSTGGYVQGFGKNWNTGPLPTTAQGSAQNIGPVADGSQYSGDLGVSGVGPVANGEAYANMVKNPQYAGKSAPEDGSLSAALADKTSLKFDSSKYEPSEGFEVSAGAATQAEIARRSAFLDAPDSLSGMKAVKAQQNMISVGQKNYLKVGEELKEISGSDMRDRLAGRMTAQGLLDKYVDNINESKDNTPAQKQDPDVIGEGVPEAALKVEGYGQHSTDYKKSAKADGFDPTDGVYGF